jgi:cytidine deaminase
MIRSDFNITPEQLLIEAKKAREQSYAPYSQCRVGAALLSAQGKIYHGCNIENAAFGPTVCAERVALFKAVSEGVRQFTAIAVVGGKNAETSGLFPPCGVCRQALREFCLPEELTVILEQEDGSPRLLTLADLLPHSFGPDFL